MADLIYSDVHPSQRGIAVRSAAGWWDWAAATPGWSTPLDRSKHIAKCTRDPDESSLQTALIPRDALVPGCIIVEYVFAPPNWIATGTLPVPENYLAAIAGRGSLALRL